MAAVKIVITSQFDSDNCWPLELRTWNSVWRLVI